MVGNNDGVNLRIFHMHILLGEREEKIATGDWFVLPYNKKLFLF